MSMGHFHVKVLPPNAVDGIYILVKGAFGEETIIYIFYILNSSFTINICNINILYIYDA